MCKVLTRLWICHPSRPSLLILAQSWCLVPRHVCGEESKFDRICDRGTRLCGHCNKLCLPPPPLWWLLVIVFWARSPISGTHVILDPHLIAYRFQIGARLRDVTKFGSVFMFSNYFYELDLHHDETFVTSSTILKWSINKNRSECRTSHDLVIVIETACLLVS